MQVESGELRSISAPALLGQHWVCVKKVSKTCFHAEATQRCGLGQVQPFLLWPRGLNGGDLIHGYAEVVQEQERDEGDYYILASFQWPDER